MSNPRIKRDIVLGAYFKWLLGLVGLVGLPDREFYHLSRELFRVPFRWELPNDDNREADGLELRSRYPGRDDLEEYIDGPCTTLEMLIALAFRMSDTMSTTGNDDQSARWFRELLNNLGLTDFPNEGFHENPYYTEEIREILDRLFGRKYARNGSKGGLFPVFQNRQDQRRIEIWYQMMGYLEEHYPS